MSPTARKVFLSDLNGDKILDAVVASHESYDLQILLGSLKGEFRKAPAIKAAEGTKPHTHDVTVAFVNNDKKADIVSTNATDGTVSVLLGDGKGKFEPAAGSPFQVARHPYDTVVVRDMDDDGFTDLVLPDLQANAIRVVFGDGSGSFTKENRATIPVGERPGCLVVADFNNDGKRDIAATHDDAPLLAVVLNDGGRKFTLMGGAPLRVDVKNYLWGIAAADFNQDGKQDLTMGITGTDLVAVMLGDGAGGFRKIGAFKAERSPEQLAVGDFNKDGMPDIVTGNYQTGSVTVLLNALPK